MAEPQTFFIHQELARKRTVYLLFLFAACVFTIIICLYLAISVLLLVYLRSNQRHLQFELALFQGQIFNPTLFAAIAIPVSLVVLITALYKTWQLSAGGPAFAMLFGAKRVYPATTDASEKRLVNVVEEMAIASGIAPPSVYVLEDEEGINAFAAGSRIENAAVIVTRGALKLFNREELQAVIGHEFSHVLNGDMRMNAKLTGFVHGVLVLFLFGRMILDLNRRPNRGYYIYSRRSGAAEMFILLLGLVLIAIGWIGTIFARLIKSAASRQREFLADASAVQFTRNAHGLTSALKKIGGFEAGSAIANPNGETVSHFFFANGLSFSPSRWFATHPPLEERIRQFEPSFRGRFAPVTGSDQSNADEFQPVSEVLQALAQTVSIKPAEAKSSIGSPGTRHILQAQALSREIPEELDLLVSEPYGARAVIYALMLSRDPDIRVNQAKILYDNLDPHIREKISQVINSLGQLNPKLRMTLVNKAIAPLRHLDMREYSDFRVRLGALSGQDSKLSIFELMLEQILIRNLDHYFVENRKRPPTICNLDLVLPQTCIVLKSLANLGHEDKSKAQEAYNAGLGQLKPGLRARDDFENTSSVLDFKQALQVLDSANFPVKQKIINAAIQVVVNDGEIRVEEGELLRALGESIGVPIPPLCPLRG